MNGLKGSSSGIADPKGFRAGNGNQIPRPKSRRLGPDQLSSLCSYPRYADDRGWFAEIFNVRDFASLGLPKFVQDNVSRTGKRGVVRGLHFQAPPFTQAKLFRVVRGKAHNVAVDLREREPTVHAMELSPDDPWLLIPPGFAHGIQTLCDDVEIHFKVDLPFEASALRTIRFDDPDLGISWPIDVDESAYRRG